jgi:hypothetical protein
MASPPEHLVIQIDRLPVRTSADPIPCAVCLVRDAQNASPGAVSRAEPGTIRCKDHAMCCATCRGHVTEDTHLCCHACWAFDRLRRLIHEGTAEALLIEGRLCRYDHTSLTKEERRACACIRCSSNTMAFAAARAMEEGEAHRLSPPTSKESEHAILSFKMD